MVIFHSFLYVYQRVLSGLFFAAFENQPFFAIFGMQGLLHSIAQEAVPLIPEFKPAELSKIAWACATCGVREGWVLSICELPWKVMGMLQNALNQMKLPGGFYNLEAFGSILKFF